MSETWAYRTSTTMGNPGNGNLRLNAIDLTIATALAIAYKSQAGTDVRTIVETLVAGDRVTLTGSADPARWMEYQVTAPAVASQTWAQLAVSALASQDPTWTDGTALVVQVPLGAGAAAPRRLATLAEAKAHLQITDATRDAEVDQFLVLASAQVYDYIDARADPSWDEVTAPDVVRAATLKAVVYNWHHRGDDADEMALWNLLRELLMRTRDPVVA